MRTGYSAANVRQLSFERQSSDRRSIITRPPQMTCLVLVRHGSTEKALLVSDTGVHAQAVWIPKAWVTVEQPCSRGILVATMTTDVARQKRLVEGRFIDPSLFNEATREVLAEAVARAARKRNFYRGHRSPHGRGDTQNAFC
jgi:hypothetical protein